MLSGKLPIFHCIHNFVISDCLVGLFEGNFYSDNSKMRNCFVPNCDKDSKYDKRMMFLPPKNPELFEKWRIVLPKKRQFKKTDKICSRHFLKEDIITTWDTQIQGKLVQLERDKPRLKDSAIPGLNLSPHNASFPNVFFKLSFKFGCYRNTKLQIVIMKKT